MSTTTRTPQRAMYINGEWTSAGSELEVTDAYSGQTIATVPIATPSHVESALSAAVRGAREMAALPAYERASALERAAALADERLEAISELISAEQGKTLAEARREATKVGVVLRLCAGEAQRIHGETIPLDACANPDGAGRLGMSLPIPAGVVVAISPFNYPILLAAHKVGPALAAGNAVVFKPASTTPLSGLELVRLLIDAGLPSNALQVLTGPGADVAGRLCADDRVRVISFTGSRSVGVQITKTAGVKRLLLELGSTAPLVVLASADIAAAAQAIASTGYFNAGQVCGSVQRMLVDTAVRADLLDALLPLVTQIRSGDPRDPGSTIGPLVSETEAQRVESLIRETVTARAQVIVGGRRDGSLFEPTVLDGVPPDSRFFCEEVFGPAIGITGFHGLDEALELAHVGAYGLTAGIFTNDLDEAMAVVRRASFGTVQINASPMWRTDGMPFGGLRGSGIGKEGPRYAVQEMLDHKTVLFHPGRQ